LPFFASSSEISSPKKSERYENCWKDISTFIKFGCIKDEEFYDKVKDIVIFKNLEGKSSNLHSVRDRL